MKIVSKVVDDHPGAFKLWCCQGCSPIRNDDGEIPRKGFACVAGNSGIQGTESWRLVLYFFKVYLSFSTEEGICYLDLIFIPNYLSSQKYSGKRLFGVIFPLSL